MEKEKVERRAFPSQPVDVEIIHWVTEEDGETDNGDFVSYQVQHLAIKIPSARLVWAEEADS